MFGCAQIVTLGICIFFSGETTIKTCEEINKARGGTMLIDEAYQLVPPDSTKDFGPEAVDAIMQTIEVE